MLEEILHALDEQIIAQEVGRHHDTVRATFTLNRNSSSTFAEFLRTIGEYYNHHHAACVTTGGRFSDQQAQQRAKRILDDHYRKQDGDCITAYNDAHEETNGGLHVILTTIADHLRDESVELYISSVFDRYIAPNSWQDKVDIIRQFIEQRGHLLDGSIDTANPERYAQNHQPLIRAYVRGLQQTGRVFRRL